MDKLWLPEGSHYSLNISHHRGESSGSIGSGGRKLGLHTVESPRRFVSQAVSILNAKRAAPHFVYGYDPGLRFPSVVQMLALNEGGRALEHVFPQETNRANVVQIEICGYAGHAYRWSDNYLKGLANLAAMIHHRHKFAVRVPVPFKLNATRMSPQGWVDATGIVGHEHCPGNIHWDPGAFDARKFVRFLEEALRHPHGGLKLKPTTK